MNRQDFLWEYRSDVMRKGPPTYVPYHELDGLSGFQSVFGIPVEHALSNVERGSVAHGVYPVWCDTLLVDFDDCPYRAEAFKELLEGFGVGYLEFNSGNRSEHFHVPLNPVWGIHVPLSVKTWVEKYAEGADTSFYHFNGQFRLAGTKHKKTGRCKVLTNFKKGCRLEIPLISADNRIKEYSEGDESLALCLERVIQNLYVPPTVGNRHIQLWSIAQSLISVFPKTADSISAVRTILYSMNDSWSKNGYEAKTREDVERIICSLK